MQQRELSYLPAVLIMALAIATATLWHQPYYLLLAPAACFLWYVVQRPFMLLMLLWFSIPLSVEVQLSPTLGTDLPDEPLMWINTAAVGFVACHERKRIPSLLRHPVIIWILGLWIWAWFSILANGAGWLALKYQLAKVWYLVPFLFGTLFLLRDRHALAKAFRFITIPMILLAGITLVRHSFSGFSFAEVSGASYPYFRNHVNYGALLVCCMPMVWLLYKQDKNRWWLPALLLMAVALYFSYSRGAWLALPVGILAAWLLRKGWLLRVVTVTMVLVCLGFAWLVRDNNYLQFRPDYASTIYHADLKDHMEATYSMKDLSTAERFYRWIAGWRMGEEHPLTGVGPNHFYPAYRSYTVEAFRTYVSDNPEHSTVHNYFLLLLSEQGFPALVIFLLLVWTLFYYAQRNYEQYADAGQRRLLQAVVAILAMIMVLISLSDLIEADKIGPLFYTCIAVVIAAGSGAYIKGVPETVTEEIE